MYNTVVEFKNTLATIFLQKGFVTESSQLDDLKLVAMDTLEDLHPQVQQLSSDVLLVLKLTLQIVQTVISSRCAGLKESAASDHFPQTQMASKQVTAAGRESRLGSCRVAPSAYTSFVIKEENKEGEGGDSHHAEITPTSGTDITAASPPLPPRRSLRKTASSVTATVVDNQRTTRSAKHDGKSVTRNAKHDGKCVTPEGVTRSAKHDGKSVTRSTKHDGKSVTPEGVTRSAKHDGKSVTRNAKHDEKCVTRSTKHDGKCVTRNAKHDGKCVTRGAKHDGKCQRAKQQLGAVQTPTVCGSQMYERTEAGVFQCVVCGREARLLAGIVRHVKTHTGGMTVQCDQCHQVFASQHKLTCHRGNAHPARPSPCSTSHSAVHSTDSTNTEASVRDSSGLCRESNLHSPSPAHIMAVSDSPGTTMAVSDSPGTTMAVSDSPGTTMAVSDSPGTTMAVSGQTAGRTTMVVSGQPAVRTTMTVSDCRQTAVGTTMAVSGQTAVRTTTAVNGCGQPAVGTTMAVGGCGQTAVRTPMAVGGCGQTAVRTTMAVNGCGQLAVGTAMAVNGCGQTAGGTTMAVGGCGQPAVRTTMAVSGCGQTAVRTTMAVGGPGKPAVASLDSDDQGSNLSLPRSMDGGQELTEAVKKEEGESQVAPPAEQLLSSNKAGMGSMYELTKGGIYRCAVCGQETKDRSNMRKHVLKWHAGEQKYGCPKCPKTFAYPESLKFHLKVHVDPASRAFEHTAQGLYRCKQCGRVCRNRSNMVKHVNRKHLKAGEKPYQCSQCPAVFGYPRSLKRHELVHQGVRPYHCPQCDKRFFDPTSLRTHSRVHTDLRPYVCTVCGNRFRQKEGLKGHMRSHTGDRPYVCEHCGLAFAAKRSLTRHIRVHTGERPYPCDQCVAAFADWTTLHNHKLVHRDPDMDDLDPAEVKDAELQGSGSENKPYQCQFCGIRYRQPLSLKRHLRVHTVVTSPRKTLTPRGRKRRRPGGEEGEEGSALHLQYRPYRCQDCGESFKHLRGYTTHRNKHLNGTLTGRKGQAINRSRSSGVSERSQASDCPDIGQRMAILAVSSSAVTQSGQPLENTATAVSMGADLHTTSIISAQLVGQVPSSTAGPIGHVPSSTARPIGQVSSSTAGPIGQVSSSTAGPIGHVPSSTAGPIGHVPSSTAGPIGQVPSSTAGHIRHTAHLLQYNTDGAATMLQYQDGSLGHVTTGHMTTLVPFTQQPSSLLTSVDLLDNVVTVVLDTSDGGV